MFFLLSKILWFFVQPANILFIAICVVAGLTWLRRGRAARVAANILAAAVVIISIVPLGHPFIHFLENRFPQHPDLSKSVSGIIVLGGIINSPLSADRGRVQISGSVERIMIGAQLARDHPQAKVIFTGGSGSLLQQEFKEAHYVSGLFRDLGVEADRLILEDQSRNTAENAALSKKLVKPGPSDTWVLITSAFHMPRAVGTFRQAGWNVIAYPVDYSTYRDYEFKLRFSLAGGLRAMGVAAHEFLGLLFYWATGRSSSIIPGPGQ